MCFCFFILFFIESCLNLNYVPNYDPEISDPLKLYLQKVGVNSICYYTCFYAILGLEPSAFCMQGKQS